MQKPPWGIFTGHFINDFNVCGMELEPILHNSKSLAWNNVAVQYMVPPDVTVYTHLYSVIITDSLLLSTSARALPLNDTAFFFFFLNSGW